MANWSTQAAIRECQIAANGELTVVERLASLLETGQFADVTITVGDGDGVVTFKAHRLLLATASPCLNELVAANAKNGPGQVATLRVKDVDPEAFQHVLKYIYTDNISIDGASDGSALLKLGRKWGLRKLVDKTVQYLDSFLNEYEPSNEERKNELCDLTVLAEQFELDLKTKCWTVLLKNVNEVVPCQGFLNMTKPMIKYLLNHVDFKFKNQLVLFEAIRDWGMNQVLQQKLSVNSLQGLIGEFLEQIDFKAIEDGDFLDTILPSECLGKSELIAFFMARGLEIPRDLSYNNNNRNPDESLPYEKSGRFKRGYKLPNQEMYKEHELRFRVDKKLKLLGVGFGFLFSNTDMGITVHCQGPWETRQWQDIIQTYCRVSWEKMKTADVRLMFSEPVTIEANHCYKVLVRVSRMSAGGSDVDLWGGTHGVSRLKMKDAEISFLKAAVDPKKEVQDSDTESKPGMITDLIYELDDGSTSTYSTSKQEKTVRTSSVSLPKKKKPEETSTPHNTGLDSAENPREEYSKTRYNSQADSVADPEPKTSSILPGPYSIRRNVPSNSIEDDDPPSPTKNMPRKKSMADEASSYYLAHKPSSIRGSDTLPAFLRARQPSVEKSQPSWQIPFRARKSSAVLDTYKPKEPSVTRESSASRESNYASRRTSQNSNVFSSPSLSRYNTGISSIKSRYESSRPETTRSRYEPAASTYKYGSSSSYSPSTSNTESRYGNTSRYASNTSDSRYGTNKSGTTNTNTSESSIASRYGSGSSGRLGRESNTSPSRYSTTSSSLYRPSQSTSQNKGNETGTSRSSDTSSPIGTSRYGSSGISSSLGSSSRYGSSTYNAPGSSNRTGSNSYDTKSTSSSSGTGSRYESNNAGGNSNRYGSTSSATTGSSLGNRYGSASSSTSSPSYLTSSRFGTNSSIGKNYSTSTNRFGSSIYRR